MGRLHDGRQELSPSLNPSVKLPTELSLLVLDRRQMPVPTSIAGRIN